jgi:hypothetical protein
MRRWTSIFLVLLTAVALSGCDVLAHETSSSSGNPLDASSLTCSELQNNGGELLSAAASELAASLTNGVGSESVSSRLQTILIAGCRQEPGGFHPAADALKQYKEQYR